MEEKSILNALCVLLNTWESRPAEFLPETEGEVPGAVITALSATQQIKRYIDGSYTGQFPFAVSMYADGASPGGKLAVLGKFDALNEWFSCHVPPKDSSRVFTKIRQTTLPAKAAVWQDGTEEYRAGFVLEYNVSPKN